MQAVMSRQLVRFPGQLVARHTAASSQAFARSRLPRFPAHRFATQATSGKEPLEAAASVAWPWVSEFLKSKANVIAAAGLGLIAVNFLATTGYDLIYKRSVLDKLDHGVMPPPAPPAPLPRDALRSEMRSLMQPERPTRFFSVILGPAGSGKSTLVRAACREMGTGVGYIEVSPAVDDFGKDLGDTFNFRLEKHVNMFNIVSQAVLGSKTVEMGDNPKLGALRRSVEALHEAALDFRHNTGKPFVLVVDEVDRLRGMGEGDDKEKKKGEDELLRIFVEYAKDWAQDGSIVTIFVASGWETAKDIMGQHPTQGRAGVPLLVGEVTREESAQLLQHLGVTGETVDQVINLVGGSLLLLERAAGLCLSGADFQKVKAKMMELMELEFESVGLLGAEGGGEGADAVLAVLSAPGHSLSVNDWRAAAPDSELRRKLIKGGVLNFDGRKVSFASKLAETCAVELLAPQQQGKRKH